MTLFAPSRGLPPPIEAGGLSRASFLDNHSCAGRGRFERRASSDFDAVEAFLRDKVADGRNPFSVAFWDHVSAKARVCKVYLDAGSLEEAQEVGFAGFRVEVAGENRGDFTLKFVVPDLDAYVG